MVKKPSVSALIIGAIVVLSSGLFFYRLGEPHLSDWDEAWHGAVSRTMAHDGELFTPKWNGRAYLEKPPLYYWFSSIIYKINGDTPLSARTVSASAGVLTTMIVYLIASRIRGVSAGIIAVTVLLSTVGYISRTRTGNLDSLFTLSFIASALSYMFIVRRKSSAWIWVMGICLLSGFLTKGFGIFLMVFVCLAYHAVKKDPVMIRKLLYASIIACTGSALWFFMSYMVNGWPFVNEFLFHQSDKVVGRTSFISHVSLAYLTHLKSGLKMWLFAGIPAVLYGLYWRRGMHHEHPAVRILSLCTLTFFGLLSFIESKNNWFLMPLYPMVAVLTGVFLFDRAQNIGHIRTMVILCLTVGIFQVYYFRDSLFVPDVIADRAAMAMVAKTLTAPDEPLYITNSYYPVAVYYSERTVYAVYSDHEVNESWWILSRSLWPDIISSGPVYIMTTEQELAHLTSSVSHISFDRVGLSGDTILVEAYETP